MHYNYLFYITHSRNADIFLKALLFHQMKAIFNSSRVVLKSQVLSNHQKSSFKYSFILQSCFIKIFQTHMYYRTWICEDCHCQVREDVFPCPNCIARQSQFKVEVKQRKNLCPTCTFENPQNVSKCQVCETDLVQMPKEIIKKPSTSVICKSCNQQNHIKNQLCVFCQHELFEQPKKQCQICHFKVKQTLYDQHYYNCLLTKQILDKEAEEEKKQNEELIKKQMEKAMKEMEECIHCRQKFMPQEINSHTVSCREKAMKALVFDEKTRMTPLQIEAMRHMNQKSEKQHNSVKSALQQRIKKLGYTIQDLNNLQFYIENYAPIIIHIHVSKHMQFFIKDTHYRSQFETNKSSGSLSRPSRIGWQDRMFDKMYSKATDFQRVKYGVINFTNDPKGVSVCNGYGQSYFLLKEHVRQRCTFTDKDSSNADSSIATFKYCFKILSKLNDNELKAAFDASMAKQISSKCTTTYKQIQIHGPIEFSKDIERIYVNRAEVKTNKALLDMVYEFNKKFNVDYDFF